MSLRRLTFHVGGAGSHHRPVPACAALCAAVLSRRVGQERVAGNNGKVVNDDRQVPADQPRGRERRVDVGDGRLLAFLALLGRQVLQRAPAKAALYGFGTGPVSVRVAGRNIPFC